MDKKENINESNRKSIIPIYKQKEILEKRINKCICKIELEIEGKYILGTGFFCKIPKYDIVCLFTNNHIIDKNILYSNKILKLELDDKKIKLNLSYKRFKHTNKELDFTVVEIIGRDEIFDYLEIDEFIFSKEYEDYKDEKIYSLQYPLGKDLNYSDGKIQFDKNKKFIIYSMGTKKGSSGSPIILYNENKVVGIHLGDIKLGVGVCMKDILYNLSKCKIEKEAISIKYFFKFIYFFKKYFIIILLISAFAIAYFLGLIFNKNKKLYYEDGRIHYIGSMKNNKPHGYGTLFGENGKIQYQGDFKNGFFDGAGIMYYKNGNIMFIGTLIKDNKSFGKLYEKNGILLFEGKYNNGIPYDGTVFYSDETILYIGKLDDDFKPKGYGTIFYPNGNLFYEGEWKNGIPEGNGVYYDENKNKSILYNGAFKDGEPKGWFSSWSISIKKAYNRFKK